MGCICPADKNSTTSVKMFKHKWKEASIIKTTQINIVHNNNNANEINQTRLVVKKPFKQLATKESWRSIIDYLSPKDFSHIEKCNKTFSNLVRDRKRLSKLYPFPNQLGLLGVSQDFPKQITINSNNSMNSNKLMLSNIPRSNNLYSINSNTNFTLNSNRSNVHCMNHHIKQLDKQMTPILNVVPVQDVNANTNPNINPMDIGNVKEIDIGFRSITSNSHLNQSYNNGPPNNPNINNISNIINNTINNSGSSNTINNSKTKHYMDFFTNKRLNISNNLSKNQNVTFSNSSLSVDKTVSFSENTVINQKNITNVTNITTINVTPVIIQKQSLRVDILL